jgi:hypothetical protein
MKNPPTLRDDLSAIRQIMERSVKFLSLTGLSGVLAGLYALAGTAVAYFLLYHPGTPAGDGAIPSDPVTIRNYLVTNALVVLILALITAYLMSLRKARKMNVRLWSPSSKNLLFNMGIPLVTGGLLILIFLLNNEFLLIAPSCLIFYGLALVNASAFTVREIRFLGFLQILLGLTCALYPAYGLWLWAAGFGLLHIIYGLVMHYRYDS